MDTLRIAAIAGSLRRDSLNRRLLDRAAEALDDRADVEVEVVDLRRHPLPIYDGDAQARDGIPSAAESIFDALSRSDAVLFANPEYNGGYPALFKNVVDWVSRIDMFVLHTRYVGLLSASPGKGGGARGLADTRSLMDNIFVTTHPEAFSLPAANDAATEAGWQDPADAEEMGEWAQRFVDGARAFLAERDAEVA